MGKKKKKKKKNWQTTWNEEDLLHSYFVEGPNQNNKQNKEMKTTLTENN